MYPVLGPFLLIAFSYYFINNTYQTAGSLADYSTIFLMKATDLMTKFTSFLKPTFNF